MNYYEHHIGDYDSATAHLSLIEDGVYRRLICICYRTESPLNSDVKQVYRLVRAASKVEREAVDQVLAEFFTLEADGWHNSRCDADVDRFQKKAAHNREVGKLGGRPKKSETHKEPGNNHGGYFEEPKANPPSNQTPGTRNQEPEAREKKRRVAALTLAELMADGLTEVTAQGWIDHRGSKNAKLTPLSWAGFKAEVEKAPGWTLEAAVLKAIARNWTGFEAQWVMRDQADRRGIPAPMDTATRNAEAARLLGFDQPEIINAEH